MIGKVRYHRRGSVVIMVVGLLTLLAMIGSTLVIVSFLDRKEARSIAATVPMKNVARSVLGRTLVELAIDLYISDNGTPNDPSDDVLYGLADTLAKRIDYPHESVDKHLASPELHLGFVWEHVTNIPGDLLPAPPASPWAVLIDPRLADTDRLFHVWGGVAYWGDSRLWDSGMKDAAGRHFMVAVRLLDASGRVNANLAHLPAPAPTDGKVMPVTDVSLVPLVGGPGVANNVHNWRLDPAYPADTIGDYWTNYALRPCNVGRGRMYLPFTVADMLALAWGSGPPDLARGRLRSALGVGIFNSARHYLTVASAGRIGVVPGRTTDISATTIIKDLPVLRRQRYKVDLNRADFPHLFNAFYNLLAHLSGDEPTRRTAAAQLAVNVVDFNDSDSNVTRQKVPGVDPDSYVYGVERQPFIVEAAYKREEAGGTITSHYAIELYNPFETVIDIRNWQVKVGANAPVPLPVVGGNTIPPRGRLVIVNDAGIQVLGRKETLNTLDLAQDVLILRPCLVGANVNYVVVDRVVPADFLKSPATDPAPATAEAESIRRDDNLPNAAYALAVYNKDRILDDITNAAVSNLGKPNGVVTLSVEGVQPCPVYVRNGRFINIADVCRILGVGPGEDTSLSEGLSNPTSLYNGRLDMGGSIPPAGWGTGIPKLPLGCMPWDFLMVHSPMEDGVDNDGDGQNDLADTNGGEDIVFGRVNINTAPYSVLQCLPGLAGLSPADRDKIVRAIISYRDLLDNVAGAPAIPGSGGGFLYKSNGRAAELGIDNLRNDPGFASPGEIVLPLLARGMKADIGVSKLPNDIYNANQSPTNYALALAQDGTTLTDDGLNATANVKISTDLVKHHVYASWLSNHVAVRSDVYLAYIAVYASTAEGSGTPSGGGGKMLTDSTKNWAANKWQRDRTKEELLHVVLFRNDGTHDIRRIVSNTGTTLTVATAWSSAPSADDSYQILSVKRRYVALIHRGNVRSVLHRPAVLMFAEVK